MKKKSDAFDTMLRYIQEIGMPDAIELSAIRTDGGGEFNSTEFENYCRINGIRREMTTPRTPEQNSVVESQIRVLTVMTRALLIQSKLPKSYWGRAFVTATYIRNRISTSANPDGQTPYEMFFRFKPNLANLRVFGCKVYIYNDQPDRRKLDERGIEGIFLGYSEKQKSYVVLPRNAQQLVVSRNVAFMEYTWWNRC